MTLDPRTMPRQTLFLFLLTVPFSYCWVPSAEAQNCQGSETVSVPLKSQSISVQKIGDAVLFGAGMEIDADGAPNAYGPRDTGLDYTANAKNGDAWAGVATDANGNPVTQNAGPYKGYYVSTTSLQLRGGDPSSPNTYVDATQIPYIALPPEFVKRFEIVLGDLAVVVNQGNGKSAYAIYADVGPHGKIGEGSVALANALAFERVNPRHGGVAKGIRFLVFPKSGLGQGKLRTLEEIKTSGELLFHAWGGPQRMASCSPIAPTSTDANTPSSVPASCAYLVGYAAGSLKACSHLCNFGGPDAACSAACQNSYSRDLAWEQNSLAESKAQ